MDAIGLGTEIVECLRVGRMIEQHAESFEQPEQLVRWYYADPSRLAEVEALVMEDNVVEWALGKMKVEDKPTEFDELMGTEVEGRKKWIMANASKAELDI